MNKTNGRSTDEAALVLVEKKKQIWVGHNLTAGIPAGPL